MKKHSDEIPDWDAQRNRIIGLGESSIRKSYYPELQARILELEKKNFEIQAAYAEQTAVGEELRQQIDETTKKEQQLRESEERYRSLVDVTDTGYLVLDEQGLVVDANDVYVRLTGRKSLQDIIGRPVTEWTAPHDLDRNSREVEKCMRTGSIRGLEIDYILPDGTIQPIEVNATVFATRTGSMILTLCRDISDRKQTQVALQQARNKLNLLNTVTFQDIQTSAFSLSAYQELLKTLIVDAKAKSYLEKQQYLLKKMVDTLDFARNYQEMAIHPPRWQNVRQVFLYAISHLDFLHLKQDLQLDSLEVFADPLLETALLNIMQNVLDHGVSATEVKLQYDVHEGNLTLFISDNGVGISLAEKNMIFDRGYGKGSGLGLFFVREVLSITGMSIRETGIEGRGTRFEIAVPKGGYRFDADKRSR
jgi:PAS domain S-box-containing protein